MADNFGPDKRNYAKDSLVMVPVAEVKIGMFVAELDRPWLGTPFLIQGFEVRHRSQIRTLTNYCQQVYVLKEGVRRKVLEIQAPKIESPRKHAGTLMPTPGGSKTRTRHNKVVRSRPAYEAQRPVRLEHAAARKALDAGRVNIKSLLHAAHTGQMIDTQAAEESVAACVQSILRNPGAMLWMSKIKDQNQYTAEHCFNVSVLAIAFGRHLRMTEKDLHLLGLCGLLHDVGKMRIPTGILDKPGSLTEEEYQVIKQHPVIGHKLLEEQAEGLHHLVRDVALNHHEQPDGGGYPRGLGKGEIAEFTRIITVVDAYDAITSNRCYSPAQPSADAQKIIYQNRGTSFDEEIALQFIQAIGPYPPGTLVELRNGMVGIVLEGKPKFRHLPTVLLLRDERKQAMDERTVDLDQTDVGKLGKEFLIQRTLGDGAYGIFLGDYTAAEEPVFYSE